MQGSDNILLYMANFTFQRYPMTSNHPFDSTAYADVIVRSSDQVDFYVIRSLLCYVSPILSDMFQLNHGPAADENVTKDGLPMIDFVEDSETLNLLLTIVYPYEREPNLKDCKLFWKACKAAQKYCMDVIERKLRVLAGTWKLMESEPLRMYAILVNLGWHDMSMLAARNTLNTPLGKLLGVDELREISGSDYFMFLEYRLRCARSARPQQELLIQPIKDSPSIQSNTLPVQADGLRKPTHEKGLFDSSAKADIILRSSDSIDFFVLESLLRVVSPVFDDRCSASTESNGKLTVDSELPLMQVEEDSETLRYLLLLIYHYEDELPIQNAALFSSVAFAVRKYKMSAIESRLQRHLAGSPLLSKKPLQVYVRAIQLGSRVAAELAAKNMLSQDIQGMSYVEGLEYITGMDLHHFMEYRFRCGDAALAVFVQADMKDLYDNGRLTNKLSDQGSNSCRTEPYQILESFTAERLKARPRGFTITEVDDSLKQRFAQLQSIYNLSHSFTEKAEGPWKLLRGLHRLAAEVEEAVSKVPLVFDNNVNTKE